MKQRSQLASSKRWVVKVGSALLTNNGTTLDTRMIKSLALQLHELREQGIETVLVSSGSVAAGVSQLGLKKRPEKLNELQAAAAVGQASLIRHYEDAFAPHSQRIAQVLLTHSDIANRGRYLNARSTLQTLLKLGVQVIVNENDTVATEEICFGDNDNLAALVAGLVDADLLVILTDQNGLYTADPRTNPTAELISTADASDDSLRSLASGGSVLGRGGMVTKLTAAQRASHSGASTVIANGSEAGVLGRILSGESLGTFLFGGERLASKKQWMVGQMKSAGNVTIDAGAQRVLAQKGKSLLPVGVLEISGSFTRGALISCVDESGRECARGLSNYSSNEIEIIKGLNSDQFAAVLGYHGESELIHRDNLVIV